MIIGNNNKFQSEQSNFKNKFNTIIEEGKKNKIDPFTIDKRAQQYNNASNKNEMIEKSLAMLQNRYKHGLISSEEFIKKCNALNNKR